MSAHFRRDIQQFRFTGRVAGLMLSLSDMRKAFFHIIQPVVHDELFDFALKMAREANWTQEQSQKRIRYSFLRESWQNFMG